jgi:hypothetical protein
MTRKRLKLSIILLLGLGFTPGALAQEAKPASGGDASGSGGSVSYTVGQVLYTTNTGTKGSVAEGVQQPYEVSVLVGIEKVKDITLMCTVYPNPATDLLFLEIEIADNENLFFQLYDMLGKLLVSKKLVDIRTTIPMANLAPATYFLKVRNNQRVVKTFKIIKNQ